MRDPTAEKFPMTWFKLYFYKARGGCCKTVCEVAWANAISAKFKGVSIKLTECALDYLLILIKFEGFFIKLPSLLNNPSHPRVIRRPGYSGWRGYKNWRVFAAPRPVGQCGGTHGICLSFLWYENECAGWWLIERIMWELWQKKNLIVQHLEL